MTSDAEGDSCAVYGRLRSTVTPQERRLDVDVYRINDDDVFDEQGAGFGLAAAACLLGVVTALRWLLA